MFIFFQVHSTITRNENSVSAELSFLVNITDNDAVYKCEVTHPALEVPLMKTLKLKVQCKNANTIKILFYYHPLQKQYYGFRSSILWYYIRA